MSRNYSGPQRRHSPAEITVPAGEIRVIESHHADGFRMEPGTWPFQKICWVAIGRGRLESCGGSTELQRDDFLLLPAGWTHHFVDRPGAPLTLVIVCISAEFLAANSNPELKGLWQAALARQTQGLALVARTAFHHTALVERIRRALREQEKQAPGWQSAVQAAASALLIRFARGHVEPRDGHAAGGIHAVAGAVEYIDAHPYEALQIADMAERCRMSPRRFTDLFRQRTGESFNAYLICRRIEFAQARLRETGHILYACHESGFNDPAYFYRVFKRQTGMTPGAFVRSHAARSS